MQDLQRRRPCTARRGRRGAIPEAGVVAARTIAGGLIGTLGAARVGLSQPNTQLRRFRDGLGRDPRRR